MERLALFVSAALLLLASQSRGQDFDLEDALSDIAEPTKKPTLPTKHTPLLDDLDLGDAVIGEDPHKPDPPRPQPNPGTHEDTGGLSDADLADGGVLPADPPAGPGGRASNPSKGGHGSGSNENAEGSQGMLAGIISSVVVAIAGAVSSFIAYQKKKLCFKQSDQENVNMESQQGAHAEPPVQRTLLQKS